MFQRYCPAVYLHVYTVHSPKGLLGTPV